VSAKSRPVEPSQLPYLFFRRAAVPALAAAIGCAVGAAVLAGPAGVVGALVGIAIVAGFYAMDLVILRVAERLVGQALLPLMLTGYVIKVGGLAIFLAVIWDTTAFNMRSLAVTVAVATVVWTVALGVLAARSATFVVDVAAHRSIDDK
jgi:ATP synthase protein I